MRIVQDPGQARGAEARGVRPGAAPTSLHFWFEGAAVPDHYMLKVKCLLDIEFASVGGHSFGFVHIQHRSMYISPYWKSIKLMCACIHVSLRAVDGGRVPATGKMQGLMARHAVLHVPLECTPARKV